MLKIHNIVSLIFQGASVCPPGPTELDGVIEGYYKRESGLLLVKVVCNALCGAQAHESLNWN